MGIFKIVLTLLPIVLRWFGIGSKDERDLERAAGERIGKAETENAGLKDFVKTEGEVKAARDGINDDPLSVYLDPDNRNNTTH